MSKKRSVSVGLGVVRKHRRYTEEFKRDAVQMLLAGHTATSVCERLGLSSVNLLYLWKRKVVARGGQAAESLEARVRQLARQTVAVHGCWRHSSRS